MLTSHEDGRILLWTRGDQSPASHLGNLLRARPIRFSPDANLVAVGNEQGTTKIWELSDRSETSLRGADYVRSLSFSPDGRRLAAAGANLQLWDLETKRSLGVLLAENCLAASFSPDGNLLAASDGNNDLHIWRAPTWKEIEEQGRPAVQTHQFAKIELKVNDRFTKILADVEQNKTDASQLLPLVYDELRRLAILKLTNEKPGQTLQATALVHESLPSPGRFGFNTSLAITPALFRGCRRGNAAHPCR